MIRLEKRTEGKIKNCVGIKDVYKYYLSTKPEDIIKYKDFMIIIKACNKELINQIVNKSEEVTLPYRLGTLKISKSKRVYNPLLKHKWAMNFQKSREVGFKVVYDQQFVYKFVWNKHHAIVKNKTGYKFNANRNTKRMVAAALRNKVDYFN